MDTSVAQAKLDLSVLNPEQSAGVVHGDGPLLVLAGAGTGKTRVITYRIARLIEAGAPADRILAVTFTNKAAAEMRKRIDALSPGAGAKVWAHTFHAFGARLLRRHHEALGLNPRFTVYDQDDQKKTVVEAMKELGLEDQKNKAGMYVSVISRAKDDLLDAGSYAIYAATTPDPFRQTAARIYTSYQRRLDAAGCLDFGDLLLKSCELMKTKPEIRQYYQELFLHVLVDEYQDTNHAQYILTKTLADKHKNLCVVGDDDQSVYSWRGANIRNILEFERDFPNTRVVTLEQNYRSTSRILEAATSVIHNNKARKAKTIWTAQAGGELVEARELVNETEEARWTVNTIAGMNARGRPFSDFAVFYRTNAQSRSFEEALRSSRVPYIIIGAHRFYERKEIKDALAYARVVVNPSDSAALGRILNVPPRGIGKTSQDLFQTHARTEGISLMEAFRQEDRIPKLTTASRLAVEELVAMIDRHPNRRRPPGGPFPLPGGSLPAERPRLLRFLPAPGHLDDRAPGQGAGVSRGVFDRPGGGAFPHRRGGLARRHGGGAPALLRGDHPGAGAALSHARGHAADVWERLFESSVEVHTGGQDSFRRNDFGERNQQRNWERKRERKRSRGTHGPGPASGLPGLDHGC